MIRRTPRRVLVLVGLTAAGGVLALLSTSSRILAAVHVVDEAVLPYRPRVGIHVLAVIFGVGLLYLAGELRRQKRRAWEIALALWAASIVVHLARAPNLIGTVYAVAMVALLWWARNDFRGRSDPATLFKLVWFVPTYVVLVYAYGFLSLRLEADAIRPQVTFADSFVTITKGLVGLDGPYHFRHQYFADVFGASLVVLGVLGIVGVVYLALRPVVTRPDPDPHGWTRAQRLVDTYGWDTLAYFALREDKSFFFSTDGEAMIAYTYLGRTALVSADPIGHPDSIASAVDEFLTFADDRSWAVGFMAAREADVEMYQARGLRHFYLGDEAIVHCDTFTLSGKKMKGVRQASNRVAKRFEFTMVDESEAGAELVDRLNAISEKWRGKNPERGFTMALSQEVTGDRPGFLIGYAEDGDGVIGGFLRFVPAVAADGHTPGYTLDLMRHDPDAPNGMTEFLTAQTALAMAERDVVRLSMNFAAWSRLWQSDIDFTASQKVGRWLVQRFNPYFQIKSLYDFNSKFRPEWFPRVIVHDSRTSLARVGILFGGVEGLLDLPVVGRYFVPRVVEHPDEPESVRVASEAPDPGGGGQPGV